MDFSVAPTKPGQYASDPSVQVKRGANPLPCSATLPDGDCTFTATTIGTYSLTANYGSDGNYLPSSSAPSVITVTYLPAQHAEHLQGRPGDPAQVDPEGRQRGRGHQPERRDGPGEEPGVRSRIDHGHDGRVRLGGLGPAEPRHGSYQFNWKTLSSYAGSCKTIELVCGTGDDSYVEEPHAFFSFKR